MVCVVKRVGVMKMVRRLEGKQLLIKLIIINSAPLQTKD